MTDYFAMYLQAHASVVVGVGIFVYLCRVESLWPTKLSFVPHSVRALGSVVLFRRDGSETGKKEMVQKLYSNS